MSASFGEFRDSGVERRLQWLERSSGILRRPLRARQKAGFSQTLHDTRDGTAPFI